MKPSSNAGAEALFKSYPSQVIGTAAKDAEGHPLMVYHGTARENEDFRDNRSEDMCGGYFAPDVSSAKEHALMDGSVDGERPYVLAAYLNIRNPVRLTDFDSHTLTPEQVEKFKKEGFDSAVSVTQDGEGNEEIDTYITFSAKQIVVVAKGFVEEDIDMPNWVRAGASRDKRLDYESSEFGL